MYSLSLGTLQVITCHMQQKTWPISTSSNPTSSSRKILLWTNQHWSRFCHQKVQWHQLKETLLPQKLYWWQKTWGQILYANVPNYICPTSPQPPKWPGSKNTLCFKGMFFCQYTDRELLQCTVHSNLENNNCLQNDGFFLIFMTIYKNKVLSEDLLSLGTSFVPNFVGASISVTMWSQ